STHIASEMGIFTTGETFAWEEMQAHIKNVKKQAVMGFIQMCNKVKSVEHNNLCWGDEVEYVIVKFDEENKKVQLHLNRALEILDVMDKREETEGDQRSTLWRPECCTFVIEGMPGSPYSINDNHCTPLSHLNNVIESLRRRRIEIEELLEKDEALLCLTSFPR
ncbi:glutamate--cysteine ligase catalytic subunit-like isoform X2, partial [Leptotrombidium deliense]